MRYERIILGRMRCEKAPQVVPAWPPLVRKYSFCALNTIFSVVSCKITSPEDAFTLFASPLLPPAGTQHPPLVQTPPGSQQPHPQTSPPPQLLPVWIWSWALWGRRLSQGSWRRLWRSSWSIWQVRWGTPLLQLQQVWPNRLAQADWQCLILRCQGCSLTSFTCWYDDHCRWWPKVAITNQDTAGPVLNVLKKYSIV